MAGQILNTYIKVTAANLVHYVQNDVVQCNSVFARYIVQNGDGIYSDSSGDPAVPAWPPSPLSASVENAAATKIVITFDMAMAVTDETGWSVTVDGSGATETLAAASGNTIEVTLSSAITNGEVVLVSYDASAGNTESTGSVAVGTDIVNMDVTNNVA